MAARGAPALVRGAPAPGHRVGGLPSGAVPAARTRHTLIREMGNLMPGQWVEVRPASEILATLDGSGCLDGMPFMPEMLPRCGRRFRVAMRADRSCTHPPQMPMRKLRDTVVLQGLRCDGAAHGGCQLGCMLMWREAWLRPVDGPADGPEPPPAPASIRLPVTRADDPRAYVCQGTELPRASEPGDPLWCPGQYLHFVRVRTFTALELFWMMARIGGRVLRRALVDPFRRRGGAAPAPAVESLGLAAGEWVEVKGREEIAATLDARRTHRGLTFSAEMYAFCGRRLRVNRRVDRIIQEDTGRIRPVKDTVILEGALCDRYLGCARGMPLLWREAWLRPAPARAAPSGVPEAASGERRGAGAGA